MTIHCFLFGHKFRQLALTGEDRKHVAYRLFCMACGHSFAIKIVSEPDVDERQSKLFEPVNQSS